MSMNKRIERSLESELQYHTVSQPRQSGESLGLRRRSIALLGACALVLSCSSQPEEYKGYSFVEPTTHAQQESDNETVEASEHSRMMENHKKIQNQRITERESDPHLNTDKVIVLPDESGIQERADLFIEAAEEFGVNPNHLATIAWLETRAGEIDGVSSAGAEGFMQVMPATAKEATEAYDLGSYNPNSVADSIRMGAAALSIKQERLPALVGDIPAQNPDVLLAAYNAGEGRARDFVEAGLDRSVLPEETQQYLDKADDVFEGTDVPTDR